MILVGLTGGIATGKSTVSQCFKRLGAYLIDADVLAHEAIAPGQPAWKAIREEFGPEVLASDLTIRRDRLGEIVFGRPERRLRLNAIVHPHVFQEQERLTREIAAKDPKAVILYDAALLIETGAYRRMDKVIVVAADRRTQIKRLMERNGLTRKEAEKRIASQASMAQKKRHADYLIDGTKPLGAIEKEVTRIYKELKSLA